MPSAMSDKQLFDSFEFREKYHCDDPLGSFCSPKGTEFRLWAPTASEVALRLYSTGETDTCLREIFPLRDEQGVWRYATGEIWDGLYYDYLVTVDGTTRATADPYARACCCNGARSMVLDLRRTDPEGWEEDKAPPLPPETVIYELHVKDFSWDPASGVPEEYRGKFKALCLEDTTLRGDGENPTCLAYLRRLGVTHVQLMPVYDYGSVDESGDPEQFNWGYDPVNYNVPEGSYATDARRGEVRVREMKQAVQALHKNGLRVIMDVVYNHTYRLDSWLWRTVPWYYYRQNEDGTPSNGSGCGNDLASERSMCAQYILDSVLYWAEEYHIDGFRFDLMGLLDADLMDRIRQELDRRWGPGEKLMLGEPWSAGSTAVRPGTVLADKGALGRMDKTIAVFNDTVRDSVKGKLWSAEDQGFVNGGGLDAGRLADCVRGRTWRPDGADNLPSQTVNYLSCHDDWTLWDKLSLAAGMDPTASPCPPALLRQNRLAAAMLFCCQGELFFLSGEEFARTKQGVKNTYRSPLAINRMDWARAWENRDLVDYYRGLIALRKQLPGLRDKSAKAADRILSVTASAEGCAALLVDNASPDSPWDRLYLAFSAREDTVALTLPEGEWAVLANGESSLLWQDPPAAAGTAALPPVSALILGRRSQGEQK